MKLPKPLRIGWKTFVVSYDLGGECDALGSDGHFLADRRRIVVRDGLELDREREVVLHEVLHAVVDLSGLSFPTEADEENVVHALTGPMLDALRSNPTLINYLIAKE